MHGVSPVNENHSPLRQLPPTGFLRKHGNLACRTQSERIAKMTQEAMHNGDFSHNNTKSKRSTNVRPMFSLESKTAIVSGAGAGIGLAVAQVLADHGANVAIWYHSINSAIARTQDIESKYRTKCTITLTSIREWSLTEFYYRPGILGERGRLRECGIVDRRRNQRTSTIVLIYLSLILVYRGPRAQWLTEMSSTTDKQPLTRGCLEHVRRDMGPFTDRSFPDRLLE